MRFFDTYIVKTLFERNPNYAVTVVKGSFTIREKYTMIWLGADGSELSRATYAEDDPVPTYTGETPAKPATAQYTYVFAHWDDGTVEGTTTTYEPIFTETVNKYTIIFVNEDGTELQSGKVTYDEMPAYTGETPIKEPTAQYTYTFAGWTPEISPVTGEATYTAVYSSTVNKYSVIFVDYDGKTVLKEAVSYDYGTPASDITLPAEPKRESDEQYIYTFSGWTPEIGDVTSDAVYTAVYSSEKQSYTITWLQDDGTQIDQTTVEYGETPAHSDPAKAADKEYTYIFSGWNPEITAVTGEATYKATYTKAPIPVKKSILTFELAGGTLDGKTGTITIEVNVGDVIRLPGAPAREGYTFLYWKGSRYEAGAEYTVEGDHTFTAVWEEDKAKTCIVTFDVNGHGTAPDAQTVEEGQKVSKPKDPAADGYTFGGWYTDKECKKAFEFNTQITKDITLYAKWTKNSTSDIEGNADNGSSGTTKHPSNNVSAVKTGDDNQVGLWIVLMVASLLILILVILKKKSLMSD